MPTPESNDKRDVLGRLPTPAEICQKMSQNAEENRALRALLKVARRAEKSRREREGERHGTNP